MILSNELSRRSKSTETESRLVVATGWTEWAVTANGHEVSFWGDENATELESKNG